MELSKELTHSLEQTEKKLTELCQDAIRKTLNHQKEELQKELQKQTQQRETMTTSPLIKLNVGGKKFMTTLATLTSMESKLSKMFTGVLPIIKDESGAFFIDRNGDFFSYVLDYLRDGKMYLPNDSFYTRKVREEIEFFEIIPPQQSASGSQWSWDTTKQFGVEFKDDNKTVTKTGSTGAGTTVGNIEFTSGVYRWKVRIGFVYNSYWVCTGIYDDKVVPYTSSINYPNTCCFSSYGEVYKMTGQGAGVLLVTGDVYEMEYDADTGDFSLTVQNKNVNLKGNLKGEKIKPFAYVWTVGGGASSDSLTLEF